MVNGKLFIVKSTYCQAQPQFLTQAGSEGQTNRRDRPDGTRQTIGQERQTDRADRINRKTGQTDRQTVKIKL